MRTHTYHIARLHLSNDNAIPSRVEIVETKTAKRRLSKREIENMTPVGCDALKEINDTLFFATPHGDGPRAYYNVLFAGWGMKPIITRAA